MGGVLLALRAVTELKETVVGLENLLRLTASDGSKGAQHEETSGPSSRPW